MSSYKRSPRMLQKKRTFERTMQILQSRQYKRYLFQQLDLRKGRQSLQPTKKQHPRRRGNQNLNSLTKAVKEKLELERSKLNKVLLLPTRKNPKTR